VVQPKEFIESSYRRRLHNKAVCPFGIFEIVLYFNTFSTTHMASIPGCWGEVLFIVETKFLPFLNKKIVLSCTSV